MSGWTRSEAKAAVFVAASEGCVWALPASLLFVEHVGGAALLVFCLAFVAAFTAATVGALRLKHVTNSGVAMIGVAAVAGFLAGGPKLQPAVASALFAAAIGLRALGLAYRDWRNPAEGTLTLGAVALGVEALLASGVQPMWTTPLALLVPGFFAVALAGRAANVWSEGDAVQLEPATRDDGERAARLAALIPIGAALAAGMLALPGEGLNRIGGLLGPVGDVLETVFVNVVAQAARPILWLADRLSLDPSAVQQAIDDLRADPATNQGRAADAAGVASSSATARLMLVAFVVALVVLVIRIARRIRPADVSRGTDDPGIRGTVVGESAIPDARPDEIPRRTPRLPGDRIRRSYAQVLIELQRAGVEITREQTPAEIERSTTAVMPEIAASLGSLTRAYEKVRYGALRFDAADLRRLRRDGRTAIAIAKRARRGRDSSSR